MIVFNAVALRFTTAKNIGFEFPKTDGDIMPPKTGGIVWHRLAAVGRVYVDPLLGVPRITPNIWLEVKVTELVAVV